MGFIKQFIEVIFYLAITVGIFILAYYSTKVIAKKSMGINKSRNLEIVEKIHLGKEKEISIVRIGNDYYLAGICSGSITFTGPLSEATKDGIILEQQETENLKNEGFMPFKSYKAQAITAKLSVKIRRAFDFLKGNKNDPYS